MRFCPRCGTMSKYIHTSSDQVHMCERCFEKMLENHGGAATPALVRDITEIYERFGMKHAGPTRMSEAGLRALVRQ